LACALVLEAAACSSGLVSPHDAGPDVVAPHDAAPDVVWRPDATSVDHYVDAAADAEQDAGPMDAAPVCPQPVAPCTSDAAGSCRETWPEVLARPPYCMLWVEFRGACGAYNVDAILNGDVETTYYYDASTGQLAAIYYTSALVPGSVCSSGPPEGIPPCPGPLNDVCLQDAGADARD